MRLWKLAVLALGVAVIPVIVHRCCRPTTTALLDPNKRYDIEDCIAEPAL